MSGVVFVTLGGLSPWLALLVLLAVAFAAGTVGAALGVGGGLFLVPALVLLFGVDIHVAIAASIVSVIATSSAAASTDVQSGLTNVRLAMFLETGTAVGGLAGAVVAVTVLANQSNVLLIAFVPVILLAAVLMLRPRTGTPFRTRPPTRSPAGSVSTGSSSGRGPESGGRTASPEPSPASGSRSSPGSPPGSSASGAGSSRSRR